jgi:gliding motility-associated-like protein
VAGIYTVLVTDANGCYTNSSVVLSQPILLMSNAIVQSNYHGQDISCYGADDASILGVAIGGTAPFDYSWNSSPIQNTALAVDLGPGSYTVTITDANGCEASSSISVIEPNNLTTLTMVTSNYNDQAISCHGANNGSATTTPAGGTEPYSYSWNTSPVQTTATAIGLSVGTFVVTISDANACSTSSEITLIEPEELTATAMVTSAFNGRDISCHGATDGSLIASPIGGTAPYTYSWNTLPMQTTASAVNLGVGTYVVTILDANECVITTSVTLAEPVELTSTASITSDYNNQGISCNGANDGTATSNAFGGTEPYSFTWNSTPSQATANADSLGAGTFTVTVIDANACSTSSSVTFSQPIPLTTTVDVISDYNGQDISCHGASNGIALAMPAGGTEPYTYSWNTIPVQTSSTAINLGANTYTVTITDANGCTATSDVTLTEAPSLAAFASITSNYNGVDISCHGANNGTALASPIGGTAPYSFSWNTSTAQTTAAATGLGASTYTVTITDINGCTAATSVSLEEPPTLTANAAITSNYNGQNISCNGANDGTATVIGSGGIEPYHYSWNTSVIQTTQNAIDLTPGIHITTITDANGCVATTFVNLSQPTLLVVGASVISDVSCHGANDGEALSVGVGGTSPYSYAWTSIGIQTNPLAINLEPGLHEILITDANECQGSASVTISEPAILVATIDSISDFNGLGVSCHLSSDGSINTTVTGGSTPYTVLWNNGSAMEDLSGLSAGTYSLFVQDANGCVTSVATTITEPIAFISSYTFINAGCNGSSDGQIDFTLNGGVVPYTYLWSNGATTQDLEGIPVGTYNLLYTDVNGCVGTNSITLTQPLVIKDIIIEQDVLCYGDDNGFIDINVSGGTLPYTYSWSDGEISEDIDSLSQGLYIVTITDAQGCIQIDSVLVSQPVDLSLTLVSPFTNENFNISFYGGSDGSIDLTAIGGTDPYYFTWSNGQIMEDPSNLTAGSYSVILTDQNGCVATKSIELNQPQGLEMPTAITPNNDGDNDYFVVRGIEAYPNNVLTIFNRWGNEVFTKDNYMNQWTGSNGSGDELPEGTYFAILEINNRTIVLKGYVEIRRR